VTAALSRGELTLSLDRPFTPSMEKSRQDFNATVSKLRSIVGGIYASAEAISANAKQLQDSSNGFALRMEKQAASVEETAADLEQITTTEQNSSVSWPCQDGVISGIRPSEDTQCLQGSLHEGRLCFFVGIGYADRRRQGR
jgi:hypothetical protein